MELNYSSKLIPAVVLLVLGALEAFGGLYFDDKRTKNDFTIVFNGEIYNHLDLKQKLIDKGHSFFSNSDTEVILAAYIEWGKDCLSRLNGMFAFAIYNSRQRFIFLARDRSGEKPLF